MQKKLFILLLLVIMSTVAILFMKQSTETITIGKYEAMPNIDVTLNELNIDIADSPDDKIHVQLKGPKLNKKMVIITEENNKFSIKEPQHKKKWKDYIHFRPTPTIVVQLPKAQSKTLTLNNADGDFTIQNLRLDKVQAEMSSGSANLKNTDITNAEFHMKDGNATIVKSAIENLSITTSSGDVAIKESTGSTQSIQTVDGQIKMTDATEQPSLHVKSVSGDIGIQYKKTPTSLQLKNSGAGDIKIKLPKYDKKTHIIGDGTNILSTETEDGSIVIK
ncbi:DUF4097 family beta strand repeat-containing protein [Rummeliibacillus pycnus]|uniref:DUF4097 family beta strand repeat-containing protein n=1 Tax=Rummeliibacillus pycnus TaxID=101070 RepID=UPI0037C7E9FD